MQESRQFALGLYAELIFESEHHKLMIDRSFQPSLNDPCTISRPRSKDSYTRGRGGGRSTGRYTKKKKLTINNKKSQSSM